ncbi:hypothetical protein [Anaerorhabdus sp.]|uniref:hypothetical protein n=1 Tax=Anaerorhabdus sp. TaxID=1872524 RepID=UPI002FC92652
MCKQIEEYRQNLNIYKKYDALDLSDKIIELARLKRNLNKNEQIAKQNYLWLLRCIIILIINSLILVMLFTFRDVMFNKVYFGIFVTIDLFAVLLITVFTTKKSIEIDAYDSYRIEVLERLIAIS